MKVGLESAQDITKGLVPKPRAQLLQLQTIILADLEVSWTIFTQGLVIIRTRPLLQSEEQEAKGRIYCIKQHQDEKMLSLVKSDND